MDAAQILEHMLRGAEPALEQSAKDKILAAMKAFSITQLTMMDKAGVRIWPHRSSTPPEFAGLVEFADPLTEHRPAAYQPEIRTIRVFPALFEAGAVVSDLRHEIAHAWDDVRNERRPRNLGALEGRRLAKEVMRLLEDPEPFESESRKRIPHTKYTLREIFERYCERTKNIHMPKHEGSFANPDSSEDVPWRKVEDFYAEGYSVFHGSADMKKAIMLRYAPELYDYLEDESRRYGLDSPNREHLRQLIR